MNPTRLIERYKTADARAERTARDQEAVRDRETNRLRFGEADRNNPEAMKLQKDLGWKMSDSAADEYRTNRTAAIKEYKDRTKQLNKAQQGLNSAVSANTKDIDKEWKKAESKFVDVRVWNKETLEGVYRLPKDIVNTFEKETFNKGDGSFTANWAGGGYNVDVHPRGTNDAYGSELHGMFRDAYSGVKTKFYEAASPLIAKNNSELNKQAGKAQGQIDTAKGQLQGQWEDFKGYEGAQQKNQQQLLASGAMQLSGLNLNRGA